MSIKSSSVVRIERRLPVQAVSEDKPSMCQIVCLCQNSGQNCQFLLQILAFFRLIFAIQNLQFRTWCFEGTKVLWNTRVTISDSNWHLTEAKYKKCATLHAIGLGETVEFRTLCARKVLASQLGFKVLMWSLNITFIISKTKRRDYVDNGVYCECSVVASCVAQ